MKTDDTCGCGGLAAVERCDAALPDNPKCAPNYHFGMLLGVEDFRAEQGFHVGRLRRHQRLLHGSGVVAGYAVELLTTGTELRVGPGLAVDPLGRDLVLDVPQCVSLPLWWLAHREDGSFDDIETPDDATIDLDVVVCHACCLGSPVPAIAEPCAGDAADVAYSRVCETVRLSLVRPPPSVTAERPGPYHLLRMFLHGAVPRTDAKGGTLASDQWLIDRLEELEALPPDARTARRASLLRQVVTRAVAETAHEPPGHERGEGELCVLVARLRDVHLKLDAKGWTATVGEIELDGRKSLLPTSVLQELLLAGPPAQLAPADSAIQPTPAGPVVVADSASLDEDRVTLSLVFSQPLADASVTAAAFTVGEYSDTAGWKPIRVKSLAYDATDAALPTVRLVLNRATSGRLVRVTVAGMGSTPLLGSSLVPAGAFRPDGDGRDLSTTITRG